MAVLMTYHKLIERENKNIDWFWKCKSGVKLHCLKFLLFISHTPVGTIFFLLITISCCMFSSWCFHKILFAYDNHCVLNAKLKFMNATTFSLGVITASEFSSSYSEASSLNQPSALDYKTNDYESNILDNSKLNYK